MFKNCEIINNSNEQIIIINNNVEILEFTYYNNEFKIESLKSSCEYSGTKILNEFEVFILDYCDLTKPHEIYFTDTSTIIKNGVKLSLSLMLIIINGESWYNSKGYYSKNHIKERVQWDINRFKTFYFEDDEIINFWFNTFNSDIRKLKLYSIVNIIRMNIDENTEIYKKILDTIKHKFNYTTFLSKTIK